MIARSQSTQSIQRDLRRIIMLTSSVAVLTACIAFVMMDLIRYYKNMPQNLVMHARVIAENCKSALVFSFPESAETTLSALHRYPNVVSAAVYTDDKQLFARYERDTAHSLVQSVLLNDEPYEISRRAIQIVEPIVQDGNVLGYITIQSDMKALYARIAAYFSMAMVAILLAMLAAIVLSVRLQRLITEPIHYLTTTVKNIVGKKDYTMRAEDIHHGQEIRTLIAGFNDMLEQIQTRDAMLLKHQDQLAAKVDSRTKELLHVNTELQQATRHKSEFLASMSHELRTPLNAIIGFSQMLSSQIYGTLNEKQGTHVGHILTSGNHLLSLIDDILDLSKIEAGKSELTITSFNIRAAIDSTVLLVMEKAAKQGISLEVTVQRGAENLQADLLKYRQILLNLLSNALKFTGNNGRIEIRISQRQDGMLTEVIDNGMGIAEEALDTVFEPFKQPNVSEEKGTGLGLALVKQYVLMHKGDVGVKSKPGQGSTFWFTFPENLVCLLDATKKQEDYHE